MTKRLNVMFARKYFHANQSLQHITERILEKNHLLVKNVIKSFQ